MKHDDGFQPPCETDLGCPIGEDLAADVEVNNYLNQFFRIKTLYEYNSISSILESGYEALELLNFPNELIELEGLFLKLQTKNQREARKWNKVL